MFKNNELNTRTKLLIFILQWSRSKKIQENKKFDEISAHFKLCLLVAVVIIMDIHLEGISLNAKL